ncbi:hypothetical protein T492DRAFT_1145558 [Pavlovales sp. CCMP2436]|nr:hypothetical protein T492DRAFT_1145558 [Pavlovales sp. CCMP2436]
MALFVWGRAVPLADDEESGKRKYRALPALVPMSAPIVQVACGSAHVLALRADALVCAWGSGALGALGHGSRTDSTLPRIVEALRGLRCRHVAAGRHHSLALVAPGGSERSEVYGWGCCGGTSAGAGVDDGADLPTGMQPLSSAHVHSIACGWDLCAAAGEVGGVAVWTGPWSAPRWAETRRLAGTLIPPGGVSCGFRHAAIRTADGALYIVRLRPGGGGFHPPALIAELNGRCAGCAAGGALTAVLARAADGAARLMLVVHASAEVGGQPLIVEVETLLTADERARARAAGGGPACLLALTAGGTPCADLAARARHWVRTEGLGGGWAAWGATGAESDEPVLGPAGARLLEPLLEGPPLLGLSAGGGPPARASSRSHTPERGGEVVLRRTPSEWAGGPFCAAIVALEQLAEVMPAGWQRGAGLTGSPRRVRPVSLGRWGAHETRAASAGRWSRSPTRQPLSPHRQPPPPPQQPQPQQRSARRALELLDGSLPASPTRFPFLAPPPDGQPPAWRARSPPPFRPQSRTHSRTPSPLPAARGVPAPPPPLSPGISFPFPADGQPSNPGASFGPSSWLPLPSAREQWREGGEGGERAAWPAPPPDVAPWPRSPAPPPGAFPPTPGGYAGRTGYVQPPWAEPRAPHPLPPHPPAGLLRTALGTRIPDSPSPPSRIPASPPAQPAPAPASPPPAALPAGGAMTVLTPWLAARTQDAGAQTADAEAVDGAGDSPLAAATRFLRHLARARLVAGHRALRAWQARARTKQLAAARVWHARSTRAHAAAAEAMWRLRVHAALQARERARSRHLCDAVRARRGARALGLWRAATAEVTLAYAEITLARAALLRGEARRALARLAGWRAVGRALITSHVAAFVRACAASARRALRGWAAAGARHAAGQRRGRLARLRRAALRWREDAAGARERSRERRRAGHKLRGALRGWAAGLAALRARQRAAPRRAALVRGCRLVRALRRLGAATGGGALAHLARAHARRADAAALLRWWAARAARLRELAVSQRRLAGAGREARARRMVRAWRHRNTTYRRAVYAGSCALRRRARSALREWARACDASRAAAVGLARRLSMAFDRLWAGAFNLGAIKRLRAAARRRGLIWAHAPWRAAAARARELAPARLGALRRILALVGLGQARHALQLWARVVVELDSRHNLRAAAELAHALAGTLAGRVAGGAPLPPPPALASRGGGGGSFFRLVSSWDKLTCVLGRWLLPLDARDALLGWRGGVLLIGAAQLAELRKSVECNNFRALPGTSMGTRYADADPHSYAYATAARAH